MESEMTQFNTCRFCDNWRNQNMVKYGTRHYAHFQCYLDAGKPIESLHAWQLKEFPYMLLKERGLLDKAQEIIEKNDRVVERVVNQLTK
jgi:hypothetical protein